MIRVFLLSLALWGPATSAAANDSPIQIVKQLQQALSQISSQGHDAYATRFNTLTPVIEATHDLPHIQRVVAGRYWRTWSAEEQQAFGERFSRLTVALYAARFHGFTAFSTQGQDELPRGVVQVEAELVPASGAPVEFRYLLQHREQGWRIVNVLVDGVSDLALRRAQVARLAEQGGVVAVLNSLDNDIERLASGNFEGQ